MSFRAPNLLRSTVGRRAGQALNLRSQVIRRRFATEGGPELVSSFISLDYSILLNKHRVNHLLNDPLTQVISSQVSVLLLPVLHTTSTALAQPRVIPPVKPTRQYVGLLPRLRPRQVSEEARMTTRKSITGLPKLLRRRVTTVSFQSLAGCCTEHTVTDEEISDGSLAPVLLRLAWHSSGTYNKEDGTGGSNYATMRFKPESDHSANNGLVSVNLNGHIPWLTHLKECRQGTYGKDQEGVPLDLLRGPVDSWWCLCHSGVGRTYHPLEAW